MVQREIQSKGRYLLAFLIGTSIFCSIFLLTFFFSNQELGNVYLIQEKFSQDIFKDKLSYSFFGEGKCSQESFNKISRDLGYFGRIINELEKKLGKEDKRVLEQKDIYTLILLEHLDFLIDYNEECNTSWNYILFFYSNNKNDYTSSEEVGKILDVLVVKNQKVSVYSFDINLNTDLIKKLKEKYRVFKAPTLIINGKNRLDDVKDIKEIEQYLN